MINPSRSGTTLPQQAGHAGQFLTTNGSILSWGGVPGAISYQGLWNASTNTPTLASGIGTQGYYYVVSVSGSTNLDGITDWVAGDWAIFNGATWQKIDNTDLVISFNTRTGAITLLSADITSALGFTPLTQTLASTKIFIGSAGNAATAQTLSLNASGGAFALGNTGILTMPNADTSTRGLLTATNWNTFNNKVSSQWTTNGNDIYYNTGNIGIGTTTPSYRVTAYKLPAIDAEVFTGSGLDDGVSGGSFSGQLDVQYNVTIDSTGTPDTFAVTRNGVPLFDHVAITGLAQTLGNGVTIQFGATTGHTMGDSWFILATNAGDISASGVYRIGNSPFAWGDESNNDVNLGFNNQLGIGNYTTVLGNNNFGNLSFGTGNMATGNMIFGALTSGNYNIGLGQNSGGTLMTGSNNFIAGRSADVGASNTADAIIVGNGAVGSTKSLTLGGNSSSVSSSIALGFGSIASSSNTFVAGSSTTPINDLYFGLGMSDGAPTNYTIHGTDGVGTDIAGGNITIQTGLNTGTGGGSPARLDFKVSDITTTGSSANTATTVLSLQNGTGRWADGYNMSFGTVIGTKFGTSTSQKLAFWNALPVVQQSGVSPVTAGTTLGLWASPAAITAVQGGTGLSSFTQGDILYSSASNTLAALSKDTNATRYLSNKGTSNNPMWAQVTLTDGVTGTLPVANGGTGATTLVGAGVPQIIITADLTAQTAAVTSIATTTAPNDGSSHQYNIGGYLTITAISINTITLQVTYTDETSASVTQSFFAQGLTSAALATTGAFAFPPMTIRAKQNTAITIKTITVGAGSQTYDVGANIMRLN